MTPLFSLSTRFARHGLAGSLLLVALQRAPLVRWAASLLAPLTFPSASYVLRTSAVLATTLGAVDTLVGATQFEQTPISPVKGTVGTNLSMTFTITGAPTPVRSFKVTGSLPPGLSMAGLANSIVNLAAPVVSGVPTQAGTFSFQVMGYDGLNATGHTDRVNNPITFTIADAPVTTLAPTITTQPQSQSLAVGASTTLTVVANGTAPLTYQWSKNGAPLAGATSATLALSSVTLASAGNYSVVITNAAGSSTSAETYVTVTTATPVSTDTRLGNLSVLMPVNSSSPLIAGFVIAGTTPRKVLVRAAGPSLSLYGVAGPMADPQLELYSGQTKIHQSDNWDASLAAAFSATGAFAFQPNSKDAALVMTLEPGNYTAQVRGVGGSTGQVLVEVYELP